MTPRAQAAVRQAGELFLGAPSSPGAGAVLARMHEDLDVAASELVFRPPLDPASADEAATWQVGLPQSPAAVAGLTGRIANCAASTLAVCAGTYCRRPRSGSLQGRAEPGGASQRALQLQGWGTSCLSGHRSSAGVEDGTLPSLLLRGTQGACVQAKAQEVQANAQPLGQPEVAAACTAWLGRLGSQLAQGPALLAACRSAQELASLESAVRLGLAAWPGQTPGAPSPGMTQLSVSCWPCQRAFAAGLPPWALLRACG